MKTAIKSILQNKRLMNYFIMAVCIVVIELVAFQIIYVLSLNYYLATVASFLLGVILNWIIGRKLVFGVSSHHPLKEFLMVLGASIGGVLIQVVVVHISVSILLLYPFIGKFLSIVFSFFWNYWFRSKLIYRNR